ncbi:MAG: 3'(2'),5'-bisphosphate nucleotidase CysQ, partial [Proteobacteria bacterium]|nr:3'(2'),5'-bisphosphate nucleotidase CysQ [Pseudomonadota bacterium]
MTDYQEWMPQLVALSHKAGEAIMEIYATDFKTETKSDDSPVTAADLAAEAVIEAGLTELAPD